MTLVEVVLLAIALALDAFAVGAAIGVAHQRARQVFRLSFHFGLFQALFPLATASIGSVLLGPFRSWGHWLACAVLILLGVRMMRQALRKERGPERELDLTRGAQLVILSASVSLDAAAAGVTLAATQTPIASSVAIIGIVTALATGVAMVVSGRLSQSLTHRTWVAELAAGMVLIGLGAKTAAAGLGWVK